MLYEVITPFIGCLPQLATMPVWIALYTTLQTAVELYNIPFPSSELFRLVPGRDELLQGLLGSDLIAFQTHSHLQHFRRITSYNVCYTKLLRPSSLRATLRTR